VEGVVCSAGERLGKTMRRNSNWGSEAGDGGGAKVLAREFCWRIEGLPLIPPRQDLP
jgi:hypothetical protein